MEVNRFSGGFVLKMKVSDLIIGIIICIIVIVLCFLALTFFVPEEYKINYDISNCSIGMVEVSGDFSVQVNKNPLNFGDYRSCAVSDCSAYNTYQRLSDSEMRCVV